MVKNIYKILIFFFLFVVSINAKELELDSEKYILYNLNDNKVLLEKNSDEKTQIASLTKIMTVIVAIENIDDFNKKVLITNEMLKNIEWDVAVAGFKVGQTVTYNDLLYGAILPSGADAVNALAYSVTNDYANFIKMMNNKAKELGLDNTRFANPIGLYDENNYSSASDVAKLLIYSLKNEKFKEVFSTRKYTSTNGIKMKSTIESYNQKNGNLNLEYITGAKTGYIKKAGYCLASTATIDDVNYLLVTLNAYTTGSPHIKDAINTYNYYSENYSYQDIVKNDSVITTIKTKYAKEKELEILANTNIKYYLQNNFDINDIEYEFSGVEYISYFTKTGTNLGKVKIKYNDEVLNEFDLIYAQTLSFSLLSFLWSYKYIIIIIIFVTYVKIKIEKRKRRKLHYKQKIRKSSQ